MLANKLQAVADKRVSDLSTKQWFLLRNLIDLPVDPPPTITMLAKETDTSRQNVRKMLEVLERQGYVTLNKSQADHRSQTVTLTKCGGQVLGKVAKEAQPFFEELFSGLTDEECEASAGVIVKIIDNLNRMQEEEI